LPRRIILLTADTSVAIKDLDGVRFVVHHLCSSTEEFVLRLFRQNGIRCHVVSELCSFESIKRFVLGNVGLAIVPRITVMPELRTGLLVEIRMPELNLHRGTVMTYRRDYISDMASCMIEIMRSKYMHAQARMPKFNIAPVSVTPAYNTATESA
jgi:DNA-binding transcriptional LysR family regulator